MVELIRGSAWRLSEAFLPFMTSGILVLNQHGVIKFANQTAENMLGMEVDRLLGQPGSRFLPAALLKLPGTLHQFRTSLTHANGRSFPATISITPIGEAEQGDKLISIMDLAELQQAQNVLLHTQRLASVGTLTASVAHELTNPLSIISATCSNLVHEVSHNNLDAEMLLHYIRMIEHSAWRSSRLVEVLRHYTYDTGMETAVTDLNMVVEDALTLLQPQFLKEDNIKFHVNLAKDLPSILCDHNRLTQVLINLLNNARDAMQPGGGTIAIKTWAIHDEASQAGELLALSVHDEGPGVPPELAEQIFEPFFTTKPSSMGTGLGLFVARELVEQHNGRIWVENHPEGGAVFTLVLPQRNTH